MAHVRYCLYMDRCPVLHLIGSRCCKLSSAVVHMCFQARQMAWWLDPERRHSSAQGICQTLHSSRNNPFLSRTCAADGIVEHVVMMGAPVSSHGAAMRMVRRVVAGRVINCYSTVDWILSLSFRCGSCQHLVSLQYGLQTSMCIVLRQ